MTSNDTPLPVGKLPAELLAQLLARSPGTDERVLLGPGIGLDCAVLDFGERLLVLKTDPITFATGEIGWYAVQVNANDIATTGAEPRWMMVTLLLPEDATTPALVQEIERQVAEACQAIGVTVIGGHTEITHGINRPLLVGTLLGEVDRGRLVTPQGAQPGDHVLLTKGVPIEATAILAREFPERLSEALSASELAEAQRYPYHPGISVLKDARVARSAGKVTAMHDPTEGGLLTALWELSEACGHALEVDLTRVAIPDLSRRVCAAFGLDPLAAIASGALLLTVAAQDNQAVQQALSEEGIYCSHIGTVTSEGTAVWGLATGTPVGRAKPERTLLPRPVRDEIAKVFGAG